MAASTEGSQDSIILDPTLGEGSDPLDERTLQEKYNDRRSYIAGLLLAERLGDNTVLVGDEYLLDFDTATQTEFLGRAGVYLASVGFEDPRLYLVHTEPETSLYTSSAMESA